jgi:hypothetical protein
MCDGDLLPNVDLMAAKRTSNPLFCMSVRDLKIGTQESIYALTPQRVGTGF